MPSTCETTLSASTSPDVRRVRQVDLRDVAGHDRLRSETEARQEHLHLLGGRVLRLVQDHERVVERAAAHERERRDLDGAPLEQPLDALDLHHVVERIVERPQVRVHFLLQIAGQEPELLARLDGRPREDDPADLLCKQEGDGLRHREVRLAGPGRARRRRRCRAARSPRDTAAGWGSWGRPAAARPPSPRSCPGSPADRPARRRRRAARRSSRRRCRCGSPRASAPASCASVRSAFATPAGSPSTVSSLPWVRIRTPNTDSSCLRFSS